MDFKYHHVRAMADKSIDLCLFNGAIRSTEQEEIAKLLRAKSKVMVAFGACACFGGIPALANFTSRDEIFQRVYIEALPTATSKAPCRRLKTKVAEGELDLPELFDTVKTLAQVVPVEYFVPGCPPPVDLILKLVTSMPRASCRRSGRSSPPIRPAATSATALKRKRR